MGDKQVCCICKKEYTGYGDNSAPFSGDRCCDECNQNYVVPLRIYAITKEPTNAVWFKADDTVQTVKTKDTYITLSKL